MGSDARLALYGPREWQVFQRQSADRGRVRVTGRVLGTVSAVEVRFSGKSAAGRKLDNRWRRAKLDRTTGGVSLSVDLPAGGWYSLEARALQRGKTVADWAVDVFGVGEVFVTAGQSNSTSCGQFATRQRSGMVSSFNGTVWQKAVDPMWGAHDLIGIDPAELIVYAGGSPWLAFGDLLHKLQGVPVGVAVTGHGGSSVHQWQPGEELFAWMMGRIWQLGPDGFRAVLWHQGESDVEMEPGAYVERFARMVEGSRSQAGWPIPWFAAKTSYHSPEIPTWDNLRADFDGIWESGVALPGPDTDVLTGDHRDFDGLGIHFSVKGLTAHGKMWAKIISPWLDGQ